MNARPFAVIAATVVVPAAVQAATVVPQVPPAPTPLFAALVAVSFAACALGLALLAAAALAAVDGRPVPWPRPGLLAGCVALVLVDTAAALVSPFAVPLLLVVSAGVLPALADPTPRPRGWLHGWRGGPVRAVLACLVGLAVVLLAWLAALLLGFFVAGPVAAALTWLVFGTVAAVLLRWWSGRYRRARPVPDVLAGERVASALIHGPS